MTLNAKQVESIKPTGKTIKRYDAGGLYLEVAPSGSKLWRYRYTIAGKQRLISLGKFPAIKLADARKARDEAKALLDSGVDPSAARQRQKAAQAHRPATLQAVAAEWLTDVHQKKVVPAHYARNLRRLELHIFPKLGKLNIADIEPPELLGVFRQIEKCSGAETASRTRILLSQIWRHAIATKRATRDSAADLKDAIVSVKSKHHAALTKPDDVAILWQAIDNYKGQPATVAALKLSAFLFVRPGELRQMLWADVDLTAGEWDYKPSKGGLPLTTKLPSQAIDLLTELHSITGRQQWVLPSLHGRGRPMSENTTRSALIRMGYGGLMTPHGFRAMARTILVEKLGHPEMVVEMQLGHIVKDPNGRAYNRTTLIEQRAAMLQQWADYLEALGSKSVGNVVPLLTGS
jgi:integrase